MAYRLTRRTFLAAIAGVIIAAALLIAVILRWPTVGEYDITDLGALYSQFGYVEAMNNKGQVVGWTETPNGQRRAFIWDAVNGKKLIPATDRRSSTAYDINDKGQVVGELFFFTGKKRSAFIWDRETGLTELGTLDGISSVPSAINNNGQVAGWIEDSADKNRAFFWDKANGMKDLGTLGGPQSLAHDINDKGQVVGRSFIAPGQVHAFIWDQDNGMVDIDPNGILSFANAINNSGKVVGVRTQNKRKCGFIWQKSKGMKEFRLPGKNPSVIKINDSGQVFGHYETKEFLFLTRHKSCFLWDPERGTTKLHFKGYFETHDINNKGQIIGTQAKRGPDHVIILTPKSKPKKKDE